MGCLSFHRCTTLSEYLTPNTMVASAIDKKKAITVAHETIQLLVSASSNVVFGGTIIGALVLFASRTYKANVQIRTVPTANVISSPQYPRDTSTPIAGG